MRAAAAVSAGYLRCELAREAYLVDAARVRSVQRADRLRPFPEEPAAVGKLASRDGDVPVYSLARRLGLPEGAVRPWQHAVVFHAEEGPWGLLVDRVAQASAQGLPTPLPSGVADPTAGFFAGAVAVGDELALVLAPDRLHPDAPPDWSAYASALAAADVVPARPSGGVVKSEGRLVLFATGSEGSAGRPIHYAASLQQLVEVQEAGRLLPVPGSPASVCGLTSWRGRPLAVLDLDAALGMPAPDPAGLKRLIVLRVPGPGEQVGVLARTGTQVVRLPLPHWESPLARRFDDGLVRGVVELRESTLILPDLRALLVRGLLLGAAPA